MWIKNLRQRKLQTIMIFLIIVICTILLAGSMNILESLYKPCYDFAKTSHSATAKVYPYTKDEKEIKEIGEQFAALENVKEVELVNRHYIEENIILNGKKADLFANLVVFNKYVYEGAVYMKGNKDIGKTLADNECILPACISNEYHMQIGDTVTIQLAHGEVSYKVAGVYSDSYNTSTAFDSDILINKLPKVEGSIVLYVYGKDNVTGKQIEEAYREKYNGHVDLYTLEDRINNGLVVGRIIGAIFMAIGIIMLLVSLLMIHYMIKNAMHNDAKSIAVFKTMGYTSRDILFMYLKLYYTIVTLACVIGIICSVFVSNTILTSIFKNMGKLRVNNYFISGILCYLVIVSFVILVIAVQILKAKKVKPVISLNGMDFGGVKKKKQYKGNSGIKFSALGIAYRTFAREKRNTIGIIITCIVTIFGINFITICLDVANSMKENNDFWLGIDKSDVMINVTNPSEYDNIKNMIESDNRTDYCLNSIFQIKVAMKWKKGMTRTNMSAFFYDDYSSPKLRVTQGRNPEAYNEIALSTTMAKSLHKEIGDYLEIYINNKTKADVLVTGIYESFLQFGSVCRLTTAALTTRGYEFNYNNISVYLKNHNDSDNFIEDMKRKIGGNGSVIKRTEQYENIMKMIAEPQQKAIPPVAVLIMLIASINIFSIVYLKNVKSQKINGIYKCIGYTTWHLICSNLCYVSAIALVSVVITFPTSLLTYTPIMKVCLSVYNFYEYPMQVNLLHLLIANTAVIAVFILSTLASSRALFKANARDLAQE